METIHARLERHGSCIRIRVRTWPDSRDLLRARLCASPQHPRAALELLEAIARWEGRTVHAAAVVDESGCSFLSGLFPDAMPDTPLVQCDYVDRRAATGRNRGALALRRGGRDEPCLPFPAYTGVRR